MNAVVHAEISSKRWKAPVEDFIPLHDFMDCSKELESSNLHRIFTHHLFFVKQVVIPVFGHTLHCSNGVKVNIKDCLELDHLISDFRGRFIPNLLDYVDLYSDSPDDKNLIETFLSENQAFLETYPQVKTKLMEPLFNTGKLKSLLLTCNSWFIGKILPLIFKEIKIELKDYNINPGLFFNRCRFEPWINNGESGAPPSFKKIEEKRKRLTKGIVFDGNKVDWEKNPVIVPDIAPDIAPDDSGTKPLYRPPTPRTFD